MPSCKWCSILCRTQNPKQGNSKNTRARKNIKSQLVLRWNFESQSCMKRVGPIDFKKKHKLTMHKLDQHEENWLTQEVRGVKQYKIKE
jgi:hypothetical protein